MYINKDSEKVLSIIASCWTKGYRFNRIKEELRKNEIYFEFGDRQLSSFMHYIMNNGGRLYWLNKKELI